MSYSHVHYGYRTKIYQEEECAGGSSPVPESLLLVYDVVPVVDLLSFHS